MLQLHGPTRARLPQEWQQAGWECICTHGEGNTFGGRWVSSRTAKKPLPSKKDPEQTDILQKGVDCWELLRTSKNCLGLLGNSEVC